MSVGEVLLAKAANRAPFKMHDKVVPIPALLSILRTKYALNVVREPSRNTVLIVLPDEGDKPSIEDDHLLPNNVKVVTLREVLAESPSSLSSVPAQQQPPATISQRPASSSKEEESNSSNGSDSSEEDEEEQEKNEDEGKITSKTSEKEIEKKKETEENDESESVGNSEDEDEEEEEEEEEEEDYRTDIKKQMAQRKENKKTVVKSRSPSPPVRRSNSSNNTPKQKTEAKSSRRKRSKSRSKSRSKNESSSSSASSSSRSRSRSKRKSRSKRRSKSRSRSASKSREREKDKKKRSSEKGRQEKREKREKEKQEKGDKVKKEKKEKKEQQQEQRSKWELWVATDAGKKGFSIKQGVNDPNVNLNRTQVETLMMAVLPGVHLNKRPAKRVNLVLLPDEVRHVGDQHNKMLGSGVLFEHLNSFLHLHLPVFFTPTWPKTVMDATGLGSDTSRSNSPPKPKQEKEQKKEKEVQRKNKKTKEKKIKIKTRSKSKQRSRSRSRSRSKSNNGKKKEESGEEACSKSVSAATIDLKTPFLWIGDPLHICGRDSRLTERFANFAEFIAPAANKCQDVLLYEQANTKIGALIKMLPLPETARESHSYEVRIERNEKGELLHLGLRRKTQ